MLNFTELTKKDIKHIWHPCTQMKDFEQYPPLVIHTAQGSYLNTDRGPLIDGISSWWCKSLGHGHPAVIAAIKEQLNNFEHVIGTTTTHHKLAEFGEKMADLSGKQHVFFASDGSSAVEIALKLCLHASQLKGKSDKQEFLSLSNSYHGETFATLSVSDTGLFKKPYEGYGLTCHFIKDLPYINNDTDPLWLNAETYWMNLEPKLNAIKAKLCGLILEPIIQGAAGMKCYSADFLNRLCSWAKKNDIYVIADEIMTGMGRTGEWFASKHANISPDIMCLSKGLTSGTIPFSCVLIDHAIYNLFYNDYHSGRSFLHSHTFSGSALAISAALATIKTMEKENIPENAKEIGQTMYSLMKEVSSATGKLSNIRQIGAVVAADLEIIEEQRIGFTLYQEAIARGAFLRPIGNSLYWLPPLNIEYDTLIQLAEITTAAIKAVYDKGTSS
jgi:adenosylmethionine-8-amino-7-oxononanoate aminotransferase